MKVVSYNCFEGAQETRHILFDCIEDLKPDILQLQEINGWSEGDPSTFQLLATFGKFTSAIFGKSNTLYDLGTLTKRLALRSEVITDTFWHSAVHTELAFHDDTLHVWNIHLNPRSEDTRLLEIDKVIGRIAPDTYTLITGDFNSIADYDGYDELSLLKGFQEIGLRKFGETSLRFEVIKKLNDSGLIDIGSGYLWQNTVPTPANKDSAHATTLRLDYAFATPKLAELVAGYRVVKNELSDHASDHYPIEIIIRDEQIRKITP